MESKTQDLWEMARDIVDVSELKQGDLLMVAKSEPKYVVMVKEVHRDHPSYDDHFLVEYVAYQGDDGKNAVKRFPVGEKYPRLGVETWGTLNERSAISNSVVLVKDEGSIQHFKSRLQGWHKAVFENIDRQSISNKSRKNMSFLYSCIALLRRLVILKESFEVCGIGNVKFEGHVSLSRAMYPQVFLSGNTEFDCKELCQYLRKCGEFNAIISRQFKNQKEVCPVNCLEKILKEWKFNVPFWNESQFEKTSHLSDFAILASDTRLSNESKYNCIGAICTDCSNNTSTFIDCPSLNDKVVLFLYTSLTREGGTSHAKEQATNLSIVSPSLYATLHSENSDMSIEHDSENISDSENMMALSNCTEVSSKDVLNESAKKSISTSSTNDSEGVALKDGGKYLRLIMQYTNEWFLARELLMELLEQLRKGDVFALCLTIMRAYISICWRNVIRKIHTFQCYVYDMMAVLKYFKAVFFFCENQKIRDVLQEFQPFFSKWLKHATTLVNKPASLFLSNVSDEFVRDAEFINQSLIQIFGSISFSTPIYVQTLKESLKQVVQSKSNVALPINKMQDLALSPVRNRIASFESETPRVLVRLLTDVEIPKLSISEIDISDICVLPPRRSAFVKGAQVSQTCYQKFRENTVLKNKMFIKVLTNFACGTMDLLEGGDMTFFSLQLSYNHDPNPDCNVKFIENKIIVNDGSTELKTLYSIPHVVLIGTKNHVSVGILYGKSLEYFDIAGSNSDDFEKIKKYFKEFTIFDANPCINFQESKEDSQCSTWVYLYAYQRLVHKMPHDTIKDILLSYGVADRLNLVQNFEKHLLENEQFPRLEFQNIDLRNVVLVFQQSTQRTLQSDDPNIERYFVQYMLMVGRFTEGQISDGNSLRDTHLLCEACRDEQTYEEDDCNVKSDCNVKRDSCLTCNCAYSQCYPSKTSWRNCNFTRKHPANAVIQMLRKIEFDPTLNDKDLLLNTMKEISLCFNSKADVANNFFECIYESRRPNVVSMAALVSLVFSLNRCESRIMIVCHGELFYYLESFAEILVPNKDVPHEVTELTADTDDMKNMGCIQIVRKNLPLLQMRLSNIYPSSMQSYGKINGHLARIANQRAALEMLTLGNSINIPFSFDNNLTNAKKEHRSALPIAKTILNALSMFLIGNHSHPQIVTNCLAQVVFFKQKGCTDVESILRVLQHVLPKKSNAFTVERSLFWKDFYAEFNAKNSKCIFILKSRTRGPYAICSNFANEMCRINAMDKQMGKQISIADVKKRYVPVLFVKMNLEPHLSCWSDIQNSLKIDSVLNPKERMQLNALTKNNCNDLEMTHVADVINKSEEITNALSGSKNDQFPKKEAKFLLKLAEYKTSDKKDKVFQELQHFIKERRQTIDGDYKIFLESSKKKFLCKFSKRSIISSLKGQKSYPLNEVGYEAAKSLCIEKNADPNVVQFIKVKAAEAGKVKRNLDVKHEEKTLPKRLKSQSSETSH